MKIILSTVMSLLLVAAAGANNNSSWNDKNSSDRMTKTEHQKAADRCTEAMIRAKLLDEGFVTRSTTTVLTEPGVGTAIISQTTPRIEYDSQNGMVTLSGTVLSKEQEQRIVNLIEQVPGVEGVNSNLRVAGSSPDTRNSADSSYTDKSGMDRNTGSNQNKQNEHRNSSESTVNKGGYNIPDNYNEQGHTGSNTQLKTEGLQPESYHHPVSDAELKQEIKDSLSDVNLFHPSDYRIDVENGRVTLTGQVQSRSDADDIVKTISKLDGVNDVELHVVSQDGTRSFTINDDDLSGNTQK